MTRRIISGSPDRLPDMARLMSEALQRKVSLSRFQKKYLIGGDAGPGFSSLLVEGGRIVGMAGCIPYRYVLPTGRRVTAAQYCDFGLLPTYRGSGVFQDLCLHLRQTSRDRGASFSIALTNEGSRAALVRALDHRVAGRLHSFEIPLTSRNDVAIRSVDRLRRSFAWRRVAGEAAPVASRVEGMGYAERGPDFVQARHGAGICFPVILNQRVMVRPGGVTTVALPGDIEPAMVGPVLQALGRRARRGGTRVLRLLLTSDDPAYDYVDQIAGPSPGFLSICVAALEPDLEQMAFRFGFADYESF